MPRPPTNGKLDTAPKLEFEFVNEEKKTKIDLFDKLYKISDSEPKDELQMYRQRLGKMALQVQSKGLSVGKSCPTLLINNKNEKLVPYDPNVMEAVENFEGNSEWDEWEQVYKFLQQHIYLQNKNGKLSACLPERTEFKKYRVSDDDEKSPTIYDKVTKEAKEVVTFQQRMDERKLYEQQQKKQELVQKTKKKKEKALLESLKLKDGDKKELVDRIKNALEFQGWKNNDLLQEKSKEILKILLDCCIANCAYVTNDKLPGSDNDYANYYPKNIDGTYNDVLYPLCWREQKGKTNKEGEQIEPNVKVIFPSFLINDLLSVAKKTILPEYIVSFKRGVKALQNIFEQMYRQYSAKCFGLRSKDDVTVDNLSAVGNKKPVLKKLTKKSLAARATKIIGSNLRQN